MGNATQTGRKPSSNICHEHEHWAGHKKSRIKKVISYTSINSIHPVTIYLRMQNVKWCENTIGPKAQGRLDHKISTGSLECRESTCRNLVNRVGQLIVLAIVESLPILWCNTEIVVVIVKGSQQRRSMSSWWLGVMPPDQQLTSNQLTFFRNCSDFVALVKWQPASLQNVLQFAVWPKPLVYQIQPQLWTKVPGTYLPERNALMNFQHIFTFNLFQFNLIGVLRSVT